MPPADDATAPSFLSAAASVVLPIAAASRPDRVAFALLFTTQDREDAICAGFECAEEELGESGGFSVAFDGRGLHPTVVLNGVDGQVDVVGFDAIDQLFQAISRARAAAFRMEGRS